MKIIYITLNNPDEARKIGSDLLERDLANCVNFFPITCIYKYHGEITEEPETVLIVKTQDGKYDAVKDVVKSHLDYDNFIGEFDVTRINDDFSAWLNEIVK